MLAALDHDALFKLLLTAFFREFIDLVAPDLAAVTIIIISTDQV